MKPVVHINDEFGCLKVVAIYLKPPLLNQKYKTRWMTVQCKCGRLHERRVTSYSRPSFKAPVTCRCKDTNSRIRVKDRCRVKTPFEVLVNSKTYEYKRHAEVRNFKFTLTLEKIGELIRQKCYYCQHLGRGLFKYINNQEINYNGIDRVDTIKGYEIDNCVPCCKLCNNAKGVDSIEKFYDWVKRLKYPTAASSIDLPEVTSHKSLYVRYRRKALKCRNLTFTLTFEDFFKTINENCVYCGIEPSIQFDNKRQAKFLYNGVDRINNAIGYELDNIQSCCWQCNRTKQGLTNEEFKAYIAELTANCPTLEEVLCNNSSRG